MLVPEFWAEASRRKPRQGRSGKQVTVRRFGWSNASQAEAQAMAEQRAQDALQRIASGEAINRREPRAAYNGADGVPIREEVLSRHGNDLVVTRNSYGAHCLNSTNALFADVDLDPRPPSSLGWALLAALVLVGGAAAWVLSSKLVVALAAAVAALLAGPLARLAWRLAGQGGRAPEAKALGRVQAFVAQHPDWGIRAYRTPMGLRLLAVHRPFAPEEEAVQSFFKAMDTDPLYVRMCQHQRCFRARLTPKPWRMGMAQHIVPRRGTWPVTDADTLRRREAWVSAYEQKAKGFAACHYLASYGRATAHIDLDPVVRLHDDACQAMHTALPLA
ncbi:MAG: hypothetical protein R3E42_13935 [Burkholderiaceae bacterium]